MSGLLLKQGGGGGGEVKNISKEQGVNWRVLAYVLTFPWSVLKRIDGAEYQMECIFTITELVINSTTIIASYSSRLCVLHTYWPIRPTLHKVTYS